jgi:hypothetical protein
METLNLQTFMKTRDDAVQAIRRLLIQLNDNPDSWENPTLDRYLEGMAAWLEDSGKKHDQPPSWDLIIAMLEAARVYE